MFITDAQVGLRYNNKAKSVGGQIELNYSNPKTYTVSKISVSGNNYLDETALIGLSGLKVGDKIKIPGEGITSVLKKIWKQGLISDISISAQEGTGNNVELIISIVERPRLTKIFFYGINSTQESEILDQVDLIRGRILTDVVLKNAEIAILKYMREKGYLNAEVFFEQESDTLLSNSVMLNVDINKNKKVKIHEIEILGDTIFPEAKLKKKLKKTGEHPRFYLHKEFLSKTWQLLHPKRMIGLTKSKKHIRKEQFSDYLNHNVKLNVFKSAKYVAKDYDEDLDNLVRFYNTKGYRDAQVISDSIYSIKDNKINLSISVEPGNKYFFGDITWTGNFVYEDEVLSRILGVEKGDVYDLDLIEKKLNYNPSGTDVSSLYMDDGYLFFSIEPVEVNVNGDSIDIDMRIREGGQATISKVIVEGNDRTNDHVIYRELRTIPGRKFSRSDLIRTQRELSQLGYFDPETINPIPIPNPANETVDIKWKLQERHNDQIELSGGWGGVYGFIGTLGFSFNNFSARNITNFNKWKPLPMGDGQKLSIRAQSNTRRYQSFSVSFSEPWLGGKKPNSFGLSYNYTVQRNIDFRTREETGGSMKLSGATISLGRRLKWPDDYFTLNNSIAFQDYSLIEQNGRFGLEDGGYRTVVFSNTFARNSVDNPMFPRSGSLISLNTSLTVPGRVLNGEEQVQDNRVIEYHKWMFDAKYYTTLIGNLVLESRTHFGFIGNYKQDLEPGPFERFTLGGSGLTGQSFILGRDVIGLRGYDDNSLTPRVTDGPNTYEGGTAFAKYVMELRYLVSPSPQATIYVLGFGEAGNNWGRVNQFNPYGVLKSAGFGIRMFMPAFGLLGIDWGYGFDDNPFIGGDNRGGQIHFSINQSLR